jgi:hypothetical protein
MKSSEFYLEILDSQVKSSVMGCSLIGKNQLLYDNTTKSYLVSLNSGTLMIPKDSESLKIAKPVLTFLLFIFPGKPFSFEFKVHDRCNSGKRIVFDCSKSILNQFSYSKLPNRYILRDTWLCLSIDLASICQLSFEGSEFCYLDSLHVHGSMFIRKIVASDAILTDNPLAPVEMSRIPIKTQEISKNFFLKATSNSPVKLNDFSPKILKNLRRAERVPSYFQKMRSGEIHNLKADRDMFRSPQVMKVKKSEDSGKLFQYEKRSANVSGEILPKKGENRATPTYLLLGKNADPCNFFQQFTSGLLKIRHETPPFVGSRGNIFYNPVQKQYDSL